MPFALGSQKPPGSGRKKGSKGTKPAKSSAPAIVVAKTTLTLREVAVRLAELNCDPIEGMARLAADPNSDPALQGRMYAELAQYIWPKRRAVEHTGPGGSAIEFDISISAAESIRSRIAGMADRLRAGSDPKQLDAGTTQQS